MFFIQRRGPLAHWTRHHRTRVIVHIVIIQGERGRGDLAFLDFRSECSLVVHLEYRLPTSRQVYSPIRMDCGLARRTVESSLSRGPTRLCTDCLSQFFFSEKEYLWLGSLLGWLTQYWPHSSVSREHPLLSEMVKNDVRTLPGQ